MLLLAKKKKNCSFYGKLLCFFIQVFFTRYTSTYYKYIYIKCCRTYNRKLKHRKIHQSVYHIINTLDSGETRERTRVRGGLL